MSIWDDKTLKPSSGNFVKFEIKGDHVNGAKILDIGTHTWPERKQPDGSMTEAKTVPKLTLLLTQDTREQKAGDTVVWTVGQRGAIERLFELAPDVGDTLTQAELVNIDRTGGRTRKDFAIEVQRAAQTVAPSVDDLA